MNLNIGRNHILMQKTKTEGGEVLGTVGSTKNTVSEVLGLPFLNTTLNESILDSVPVNVNFPDNHLLTIFMDKNSKASLEETQYKRKVLALQEKYTAGEEIGEEEFQFFLSKEGLLLLDAYCYYCENQIGNSQTSVDSVQTGFIFFLISGFNRNFENIFAENMLFDIHKVRNIFDDLLGKYNSASLNGEKMSHLQLIIFLCNFINTICLNSQLDAERKGQIEKFLNIMSEAIVSILSKYQNTSDKKLKKMMENLAYIYHRNMVFHSYTIYIETQDQSHTQILNSFKDRIHRNITSTNEVMLGLKGKKNIIIPASIGNISYLVGVLISKINEKSFTQDERKIFSEIISQYLNFLHRVLEHLEIQYKRMMKFSHNVSFGEVLDQLGAMFQLTHSLISQESVPGNQNEFKKFDDYFFILKSLQKKDIGSIDYETVHNLIMFSQEIPDDKLGFILDLLLQKSHENIDMDGVLLKNIDVTLKKLSEKNQLTIEHIDKVERYISNSGKNSKLLVVYSRLYLTLAYFYALHKQSEKTKKYLYKFTKIKGVNTEIGEYLQKYGHNEEQFLSNIRQLEEDEEEDTIRLEDGTSSDRIMGYIYGYESEYYIDLTNEFLEKLEELRKTNQHNINIILDFIRNNVFYGICDIFEGSCEYVVEKGEIMHEFRGPDGKTTLKFVYREQYASTFEKLLKLSKKSLQSMIKHSRKELELSEEEQKNLSILSEAIEEGRLKGFYQPITDEDGNIVSYELLMRIKGPDGNVLYPNPVPFLDVARKKGMIPVITRLMVEQVARDLKEYPEMKVSINMDANDLLDDKFLLEIKRIFSRDSKLNSSVSFEILESAWLGNSKNEIFTRLNDLSTNHNIHFALDDFGTGEASVVKLMELLDKKIIKKLKIDQELIKNLFPNDEVIQGGPKYERTVPILRGIFEAAQYDGVVIICEFIKKPEWLEAIRDEFKGFTIYYQGWGAGGKDTEKPSQRSVYSESRLVTK